MRQFSAMSKAALGFISRRPQLPCIWHGSILGRGEITGSHGGLDVLRQFSSIAGIGARGVVNEENIVDKGILKWDVFRARIGSQQTRGFLGCGDCDEDSGLAKTYEEKRIIGRSSYRGEEASSGFESVESRKMGMGSGYSPRKVTVGVCVMEKKGACSGESGQVLPLSILGRGFRNLGNESTI